MGTLLKRIRAEGLHGRLSFDVSFYDDVNILYGRNGSGKTTLLHILANVLNGSFERFAFLEFERIVVDLQDRRQLTIQRRHRPDNEREVIEIFVDERHWGEYAVAAVATGPASPPKDPLDFSFTNGAKYLPRFEELRSLLGLDGAAYFPAFRTMIEAWWSAELSGHGLPPAPGVPPPLPPSPYEAYLRRLVMRSAENRSAFLTDLARELFGDFAPVITYPSTMQIDDELRERLTSARYRVKANANVRSSWLFIDGLLAVLRADERTSESLNELKARIGDLLTRLDQTEIAETSENQRADLFQQVGQVVDLIREHGEPEPLSTLLSVFAKALEDQLHFQQQEYAPFERYISSVNSFLEDKLLRINRSISSEGAAVTVEFDDGTSDDLRVLSSGERQIVSMLYAATTMEPADVVLIDEPELSLHVDWQRRLLPEMREQLGNRQMILCTHSPMIGAEFEDRYQEVGRAPALAAAD
jgi:ABC-type lipoprotein export system ATPase subunit